MDSLGNSETPIPTNDGRIYSMTPRKGQMMDNAEREMYELVCKGRLDSIDSKLDRLLDRHSEINVRLTCLEQTRQSAAKAVWIAVTAFCMAAAGTLWGIVARSGK